MLQLSHRLKNSATYLYNQNMYFTMCLLLTKLVAAFTIRTFCLDVEI